MERKLYTKQEVIDFISKGNKMVLTADEKILKELPKGNWIGGSTPYFMDKDKGKLTKELIFVDDFTNIGTDFKIEIFSNENIKNIAINSYQNGFTVLILPLESPVYYEFALNSLSYDNIFQNPVVGFVAGFDYADLGKAKSKVINGQNQSVYEDFAVAMHIALPENKIGRAEILCLDTIQPNSDIILFDKTSFIQSECLINGKKRNLAEYLTEIKYLELAPRSIVSNTNGALINRDIKEINLQKKEVSFFSPVYAGDEYYLTNYINDYQTLFNEELTKILEKPIYTSICVSYYLLGNFQDKKINIEGAFAFGEIAFQLLNKTLVLLVIDEK